MSASPPSPQPQQTLPTQAPPAGLICLELVLRIHQVAVDLRALIAEFGITTSEPSPELLLRMGKQAGMKCRLKKGLSAREIAKHYPLPAVGYINGERPLAYLVLLKLQEASGDEISGKALCYDPHRREAVEKDLDELPTSWLIFAPSAWSSQVKFGFDWFFKEILTFKLVIAEVLLGSFFIQLFGLVTPLFTQIILDKVIVHRSLTTLDVLGVAFLAMMIFEFLLSVSRTYIFTHTANKIDAKLGAKLFRHLFSLPIGYFEARKVGDIMSRVRELETIREFITQKAVSLIIDVFFSLVFVGMMALYSVPLTLMVIAAVAVIGLFYFLMTPMFRKQLEKKFQLSAKSNSYLVEAVTGVQTVKTLSVEGRMQKYWEDNLGQYLSSSFELSKLSNVAKSASSFMQRGVTILILYFGVRQVIAQELTIGQLIAFNMFASQFTNPVLRLVGLWHELQQTLLAVNRLSEILNHPTEVDMSQGITLPKLQGGVRLDKLNFSYAPGLPTVIQDLTLNIPPGTSVGIVGRSGSGKSTLTKLIQRLYLPTSGVIYIDGVDTRHLNPRWLRQQIGVVLQENYLFSGTIRENIALTRPDAPIEHVMEAARLAGAHEFITELVEGYDTKVGERGASLSGGQRQRIAIARALLNNPRVLIFDEATSALDYESEMIIKRNLKTIRSGRTVLIIAHRLSTVQECDVILVMDRGRLVEAGKHSDLLAQKGIYHHLYTLQQQEGEEAETRVG